MQEADKRGWLQLVVVKYHFYRLQKTESMPSGENKMDQKISDGKMIQITFNAFSFLRAQLKRNNIDFTDACAGGWR
jgi:hypothetical protein